MVIPQDPIQIMILTCHEIIITFALISPFHKNPLIHNRNATSTLQKHYFWRLTRHISVKQSQTLLDKKVQWDPRGSWLCFMPKRFRNIFHDCITGLLSCLTGYINKKKICLIHKIKLRFKTEFKQKWFIKTKFTRSVGGAILAFP